MGLRTGAAAACALAVCLLLGMAPLAAAAQPAALPTLSDAERPAPRVLRAARFSGHTQLTDTELQALAAPFLNRPLRDLDLEELRQTVSRAYVERGYVNSGAVVDRVDGDTVHLRVVEGVVSRIRQTGQGRLSEAYLATRLARPGEPLQIQQLQDRFQLLLADPLFERLNARLLPDDAPGRSLLDVEVTRAPPWQLALFAHNHLAPAVGAEAVGLDGTVRNLTGWGDRLGVVVLSSGGSLGGDVQWAVPLAAGRTTATLRVARQRSSVVEEPLDTLDIRSVVDSRDATLSHALVDEPRARWVLGLTHALRRHQAHLLDGPYFIVPGEATGTLRTEAWRAFVEGTQRLGSVVAAVRLTAVEGRTNTVPDPSLPRVPPSRYRLWQLQGQATWPLADNGAQLVLRGQLQRANQPLVPLEQMAIGGRHTVRGWRENSRVRDHAQAFSAELHWPLRRADAGSGPALTLVPFVDAGSAWNDGESRQHLSSAGLGLQLGWSQVDAELFVGRHLNTRNPDTRGDAQDHGLHFQLRWRPSF